MIPNCSKQSQISQVMIIQDYTAFVMNELNFDDFGRIIEYYDMQVNIHAIRLPNTNRQILTSQLLCPPLPVFPLPEPIPIKI